MNIKNKIKNKKAWLRIVEASMAVMILISFVIITMNKVQVKETNMQEKVNELILKIEKNEEIRQEIFSGTLEKNDLGILIKDYDFSFKIDGLGEELPPNKEIFAASIILTKLDNTNKKFTLFIWS